MIEKIIPRGIVGVINSWMELIKRRRIGRQNSKKIKELLSEATPIKLELGAGDRRMDGWVSVDRGDSCALNLDLTGPMPFPDNSVSIVYSSHVLEHFTYSELIKLLEECLRILKPGGTFSASVPNARIYVEAYHSPDNFNPDLYCRHTPAYNYNSKIDYVNYMAYMDGHHKYMFDEDNIIAILKKTGFRNVRLRSFDKALDLEVRDFQSIYVQAEK